MSLLTFHLTYLQVAKQLKDQQMVMRGHREKSMVHELNRYVVSFPDWYLNNDTSAIVLTWVES